MEETEEIKETKKEKNANGEGCLYFEKKRGYWRATITLPNGKRKDFCSKNKNTAILKRNKFISSNYSNNYINTITLVECSEEYLKLKYAVHKFSDNTYRTHLDTLIRLKKSEIGNMPVQAIQEVHINQHFAKNFEKYSKSILSKDRDMINWGLKYAVSQKIIQSNPYENMLIPITFPKEDKKVESLTQEQFFKFLELAFKNINELYPYSVMWLIMMATGLRVGEICSITMDKINLIEEKIQIDTTITRDLSNKAKQGEKPKTSSGRRTIYFSTVVEKLLDLAIKRHNEYSIYLFSKDNADFIRPQTVTDNLRQFNQKYQIAPKITSHMLRHTYATYMIRKGFPAFIVQHLMGHSSINITLDTYTSFFPYENKEKIEEMNTALEADIKKALTQRNETKPTGKDNF